MEGYWYTLNHKPIKRRLMIAALRVTPNDVEQLKSTMQNDWLEVGDHLPFELPPDILSVEDTNTR